MSYLKANIPHHSIPSLGTYIILIPSSLMFSKSILQAIDVSFKVSTERALILSNLASFESEITSAYYKIFLIKQTVNTYNQKKYGYLE